MPELNTFRHETVVAPGVVLVDLGDRLVITQTDDDGVHDVHLDLDYAQDLVAAIMARLNP